MISVILSSVVIAYSILNLFNIKRFISESEDERFTLSEAILIVFIYVWLIVNFFLLSGPVVMLLTFFIALSGTKGMEKNITAYLRWFFVLLIITSVIIAVNNIYFKFSMWQYIFVRT